MTRFTFILGNIMLKSTLDLNAIEELFSVSLLFMPTI